MKTKFNIFLSIFLIAIFVIPFFVCSGCKNAPQEVDVILLSGQSNMVGVSERSELKDVCGEDVYNELVKGYNNIEMCVQIHSPESAFIPFTKYTLGLGAQSDQYFGLEVGICKTLNEYLPNRKIFLIKCAIGASSIYDNWQKDCSIYQLFEKTIQKSLDYIKSLNYNPKIKAMCWMQGESDYGGYEQYYYDCLVNLKTNLTNTFDEYMDNFSFIDTTIQFDGEINEAKKKFALLEGNYYIDTDIMGIVEPNVKGLILGNPMHYNAKSEYLLGQLFGRKLVGLI